VTDLATPATGDDAAPTLGAPTGAEVGASTVDATADAATDAADDTTAGSTPSDGTSADSTDTPLAWGPAPERARHPWRRGLLIGVPVAAVLAAAWYFGTTLIAPGMVVGNVPVGGLTVDAATAKINAAVADTALVLRVDGAEATVTGSDLGAHVDARPLAARALAAHPLWNVTSWFPDAGPTLRPALDAELAGGALRGAFPELYVAPVDAGVEYAPEAVGFVAVDGVDGWGVPQVEVRAALLAALNDAEPADHAEIAPAAIVPDIPSRAAHSRASVLNGMLDTIGFYVGSERVAPIDRATAASWIAVEPDPSAGIIRFAVDGSALPAIVEGLPAQVNRDAVDTQQVVNSAGDVLRTIAEGTTGIALTGTEGVADAFAAQLNNGVAAYQLDVTETPFGVANLHRRIEVNVSTQRTILYENDQVVRSWSVSTGLPGHDTNLGNFKVYAHVRIQDMGSEAAGYLTKDVPWVSYFNGDEAFHGAYWHNNFGNRMSHGCVNMRIPEAKFVYEWAPIGTEVWVHR
jgi:hypothetical protein